MRTGLVTGEFPPMQGGVGDFTCQLARALSALGPETHVITSDRAAHNGASGLTVHPVIKRWSFLSILRVRALARRLNLDLLNLQYQAAAFALSAPIHFLPHLAGLPVVVTFHDLRVPYFFPKAGSLRSAAITHLARSAAGVITTDPTDGEELKRRGGIKQLAQIPIGSNIVPAPPPGYDRNAWRDNLGVRRDEMVLGYFGFLNQSKGGDTLLSALGILDDRKTPVKLLLIGGLTGSSDATNAAFEAQIERQISLYDLGKRIIRTGFVETSQVSGHLLACDVVVLPYRDGVSFRRGSLLAALAHGCAVVTTQPSGRLPELSDGENVRLVPPESAPALVLAITELLNAPDLRARLGQAARKLASNFSWETIAARTLEFYRSIGSI